MSLVMAIRCARIHQTRLLLDIGIDPNTPDRETKTPLMLACLVDKQHIGLKIAKMLLEKEALVSTKDRHRRTALSYACMTGNDKIVRLLLDDIEYDINAPDDEGNTPLMYAAMSGNGDALGCLLQVLVKYRLSVDMRNNKGFSAYLLAAKMGHFYCAHILKTEGYASDGIRDTEFFLSDKEWIRKFRKQIATMQLDEKELDSGHTSSRSHQSPRKAISRPQTSLECQRVQSTSRHGPDVSNWPRAESRFTTRSDPPRPLKYNSWINQPEQRRSSQASGSSASSTSESTLVISDSSCTTESVPSEARTKTPDLHAILSHYIDSDVYRPAKPAARNEPSKSGIKFSEITAIKPARLQRKQTRMNVKQKQSTAGM